MKDKTVKILAACALVVLVAIGIRAVFCREQTNIPDENEEEITATQLVEINQVKWDSTDIDSREKLLELMKAEVLDAEITDVKWQIVSDTSGNWYSRIFAFLKEEGELEYMDYYYDKDGGNEQDPDLTNIPPGDVPKLEEIGISLSQIQKHGTNFGNIQVDMVGTTYYIDWFQIDETYDGESNVLLFTSIPCKAAVDVEGILSSPDNGKKADAVVIDSREELAELMNVESLDAEITGVRCKETGGNYTVVLAFLKESGDLKEKLQYHDLELKYIPDVYISLLEEMGIGLAQIQDHWINYADIQAGNRKVQYHIDLFQLDDTYNGEGNVILMAGVPRRISVDADKILAPAQ